MRTSIPRAPSRCPLLLLSSVLVLLLFGCATARENGASSPTGETASPAAGTWRSQDAPGIFFAETELGCYCLGGGFLYFAPAGSTEFQLLCSRPDCAHTDENCNAYAGEGFTYYNGNLYAVCSGINSDGFPQFQVVQISPDGSSHEHIGCFQTVDYPDGSTRGPRLFTLHGKCAYYTIVSNHPGASGYESHIFRMDVTTGKSTELPVSEESARCTGGYYFQFDGEKWYFVTSQVLEDGSESCYLACVDMEAGAYTLVAEGDCFNRYVVEDGIISYFQPGQGFCQLDTASGEDQCILPQGDGEAWCISTAHYDRDRVYCTASTMTDQGKTWCLQIYDRDYNLIDQVAYSAGLSYLTATQDYILFGRAPETGTGLIPAAYINKSDIGSGNLELISIGG